MANDPADLLAYARRQTTQVLTDARLVAQDEYPPTTAESVIAVLDQVLAERGIYHSLRLVS